MKGRLLHCLLAVYLAVELILGFLIHTASPTYLYMYISVVIAFLGCVMLYKPTLRWVLTATALAFTLGADCFLVVLGSQHTLAMCLFSVTQLCYAARVALTQGNKERRVHLILRAVIVSFAVAVTFAVLGKNADALAVVSLFYYANLLLNAGFATAKWRSEPLFAAGLWLFVLCDLFIGFNMLGNYLPIGDSAVLNFLAHPPINMAWVFYLPSQVLLGMSALERGQLKKK